MANLYKLNGLMTAPGGNYPAELLILATNPHTLAPVGILMLTATNFSVWSRDLNPSYNSLKITHRDLRKISPTKWFASVSMEMRQGFFTLRDDIHFETNTGWMILPDAAHIGRFSPEIQVRIRTMQQIIATSNPMTKSMATQNGLFIEFMTVTDTVGSFFETNSAPLQPQGGADPLFYAANSNTRGWFRNDPVATQPQQTSQSNFREFEERKKASMLRAAELETLRNNISNMRVEIKAITAVIDRTLLNRRIR